MFHVCDHCGKDFKYKKNLIRHIRERHQQSEYYPCVYENCRREFIRLGYLKVHLIRVHRLDERKAVEMMHEHMNRGTAFEARKGSKEVYAPELEDISSEEENVSLQDYTDDVEVLPAEETDDVLSQGMGRFLNDQVLEDVGNRSDEEDKSRRADSPGCEEADSAIGVYDLERNGGDTDTGGDDLFSAGDDQIDMDDEDTGVEYLNSEANDGNSSYDENEGDDELAYDFASGEFSDEEGVRNELRYTSGGEEDGEDNLYDHFYGEDENDDGSDDDIIILDDRWPEPRTLRTVVECWTRTGYRYTTYRGEEPIFQRVEYEDDFHSYEMKN